MVYDDDSRRLAAEVARHVFRHHSGVMLGGLLHNLRSPLGGVVMLVSYLRESVDAALASPDAASSAHQLLNEMQEHMENIESCTSSLEEIITELSRYELHGRDSQLRPRDLNVVVRDVAAALRSDLDIKHRVQIRLELAAQPLWFSERPADVIQVLLWLTANARDAVLDRDERIVTIRSGGESDGQWVWFEVTDTGGGMSEATQATVREPFVSHRRGDPSAERRGVGSGLGGFLADCMVQALGGQLRIESSDVGATVRVLLPAAAVVPGLLDE